MSDNTPFSPLNQDLQGTRQSLNDLRQITKAFSKEARAAFSGVKNEGRGTFDYLRSLMLSFSKNTLSKSLAPLSSLLGTGLSTVLSSFLPETGKITPFASGGIFSSPTTFPMKGGLGLAGEAGPEAILPLGRNSDGSLGVRAQGGTRPMTVNIQIQTPDLAHFQKSQSQISASIAQALRRGTRNL